MGIEDDTYNIIFKAMQHPIRRRILRTLSESSITYTEVQKALNIDNGLLNYHLETMSSLITKDNEEKYTLSDFGRATAGLIRGVEEPSRAAKSNSIPPILKVMSAVLVIALIVSGVGLIELNNRYLDLSGRFNTQSVENTYLQAAVRRLNATLFAHLGVNVGTWARYLVTTTSVASMGNINRTGNYTLEFRVLFVDGTYVVINETSIDPHLIGNTTRNRICWSTTSTSS
jgi:DNA-binding transcriptional ArsR family regulator